MRLHVVTSSGATGGAELALVTFLEHRPDDVTARATVVGHGPLAVLLAAAGVPARETPQLEGWPPVPVAARFALGLARTLRRERPDVVWAMGQKAAMLAAPAARLARVPLVWHKVDLTRDARVARPLARAAGRVISVSEAAAAALGPDRERRLLGVVGPPVGLPADFRVRPATDPPAIGTLGRLVGYKGHALILRAAALLAGEVPDLRVVLAGGEAPEAPGHRAELERLAGELGLAGRVELPGFVPATAVLGRLTAYVNATHRDAGGFGLEALSGAMLEASWAGLPVVATAGGGTAEGLRDGETGTLVDRPEPAALAAALRPYLRDPALAAAHGAAGAAFARERCAPDAAARRVFTLLGRAAAGAGARP